MLIAELLNKKVDYEVSRATSDYFEAIAEIGSRTIRFSADKVDVEENGDVWEVEFAEYVPGKRQTYQLTGSGNELEVFAMVKDCMLELVQRYQPYKLKFTADKDNGKDKRGNTYERLIKRFKMPGYSYERTEETGGFAHSSAKTHDKFVLVKNH